MALPVSIEDLLRKRKVESNRIEFKTGWNPSDVYHSIVAFANDIDNLGGGYVLIGVEEENGVAKRPVKGIPVESVDRILKQMVGFNNQIAPYYMPRTSLEEIDGQNILVIWAPSGVNRPYSVPVDLFAKVKHSKFYVRNGSSSIEAKGSVMEELWGMANREPFDERLNPRIKIEDISMALLRDYLVSVKSRLAKVVLQQPIEETLEQMDLMGGPTENRMLKNVAAMMFCEHLDRIFPYTQIEIVIFKNGRIKNPNEFSEKIIKGSVPSIINGALSYLNNNIIQETVVKQKYVAESIRYFNYPIQVIEEAIVNAMYHRDYMSYEPVQIIVEPNEISIFSIPGPDRSIPMEDINRGVSLRSYKYRNRRLGDYLKELNLTEGRCTGIPTIQDELMRNGSDRATIETDEERSYFVIHIPCHKAMVRELDIEHLSDDNGDFTPQAGENTPQVTPQAGGNTPQVTPQATPQADSNDKSISPKIYKLLCMLEHPKSLTEILNETGIKDRRYFRKTFIRPAIDEGFVVPLYEDNPNHPKQKYCLTEKGRNILR